MNVETDQVNTSSTEGQAPETANAATAIPDLDGMSSFNFQGKTYTPDQLVEVFQSHSKYGEVSKYSNDDYWNNYYADVEKVKANPSLREAFNSTYPEKFRILLDRELSKNSQGQSSTGQQSPSPQGEDLRKMVEQLVGERLKPIEQESYQAKVQAATAQIDQALNPLLEKYQLANEDKVLLEAEKFLSKGGKMTAPVWERLVKEDHERMQKRSDKFYQAKLKEQKDKAMQGKDTGGGGGAPGASPNRPKTFAEAEAAMIKSMQRR